MFDTFRRSWQLVKASWAVLMMDKELLWFPILSGIVMILTMVVFFTPIAVIFGFFGVASGSEDVGSIIGFVLLFLYYLLAYTVSLYFNVALVGAVMIRLDGGDPTMRDGLKIANQRLGKIVIYAFISATVGVILQTIRERGGIIGSIASSFLGMAWNLATFFVVPILVVHDIAPWDAIKESTALLKKTWGEQVAGGFGVGAITGLATVVVIILGVILIALVGSATQSGALIFGLVLLLVAIVIAIAVISGALAGVFRAMVYRYAETGVIPDAMDIETIKGAFKPKVKRGMFG
jgi:hypothetical protein